MKKHLDYKKLKDPGSAISHGIGLFLAILFSIPLLIKAAKEPQTIYLVAMAIYSFSLIMLYAASTFYHSFDVSEKSNTLLKKIDHMMIFVLIAGSYTPICLLTLRERTGILLLIIIWGTAILGIIIKAFFVYCPKWVSSILYIGMGWACVFALPLLIKELPKGAFLWLLMGGILYTIGGIIYAFKLSLFNKKHPYFGSHEIFHIFVLLGSISHFILMFFYLLP